MFPCKRRRITIFMMRGYGDNVRSYEAVAALFNNTFPIICQLQSLLFNELSLYLNKQVQ